MATQKFLQCNVMPLSVSSDPASSGFEAFRGYLQQQCGIVLAENKHYLVESRLRPILESHSITSLQQLLDQLQHRSVGKLKSDVINAMTTNETSWFRDVQVFDAFQNLLLPAAIAGKTGNEPVRIWSAACSSGQEPYSLSMAVQQHADASGQVQPYPVRIMATDICSSILEEARRGIYSSLQMSRGLSAQQVTRFFEALPTTGDYRLRDTVRSRVEFSLLNLQESFSALGRFDMIFCRNVFIYFSDALKMDILSRMHRMLNADGVLIMGCSESIHTVSDLFVPVLSNGFSYYKPRQH